MNRLTYALVFVTWFLKLKYSLDRSDPLRALREKAHAPAHAAIDEALSRRMTKAEICRMFQVPPELVGCADPARIYDNAGTQAAALAAAFPMLVQPVEKETVKE